MRYNHIKFRQKLVSVLAHLALTVAVAFFVYLSPVYAQDADPAEEPLQEIVPDEPSSEEPEFLMPDESGSDEVFGFDQGTNDSGFQESTEQLEQGFRQEAFDAALQSLLPLKPDEIRTLLERFDQTVQSSKLPVHPNPRPESSVQNISLDPGALPIKVSLATGYVTTLSFLDSTGAPWPIEDISWVGDFEIQDSTQEATSMIRISPSTAFAQGNMSIRLIELDAPIILTFETSREMVHYRFDAIVPGNGPNAAPPIIDPGITIAAGDVKMASALTGVWPEGAEKLNVTGVDGRTSAYRYNGMTYVRTPLNLLSPGWSASVSSADGTKIYAIQDAPVLLLSDKGRMIRAYLAEREDPLDEQ